MHTTYYQQLSVMPTLTLTDTSLCCKAFFAEVDNEWSGLYVMRNQFIARDECEYYPTNLHRHSARNNTGQFDVVNANWSGDQGSKQSSDRYKYKLKATCVVVRGRYHEFQ